MKTKPYSKKRTQEIVTQNIEFLLRFTGDTRTHISEILGVTPASLSFKMNGRSAWSLSDIDTLAEYYNVNPFEFLMPNAFQYLLSPTADIYGA